jgi:iron complex transport system ATP-binding protein
MRQNIPYLHCKDLTLSYQNNGRDFKILESISLSAYSSELIGLIGKNGSGKTTLLRGIMGIVPISEGEIKIQNTSTKEYTPKQKARKVAYVEAAAHFPGNLRICEVVAYGRYPYASFLGGTDKSAKQKIVSAMEQMNILHLANRQLFQVSDGEKQACMIARALAQDTPIILLDEPAAHLDIANRYKLMSKLKLLAKEQNKCIIMSSHDLDIILNFTDKLWMIHQNKIIKGAPEDIVLNLEIRHLVDSENIQFSLLSGKFEWISEKCEIIGLHGKGDAFLWTKHALTRVGFDVKCNKVDGLNVFVSEKDGIYSWDFSLQDEQISVNRIEDLINLIKQKHEYN